MNMEARDVNSGSVTRKCVVVRLIDLTLSVYQHMVDMNAGAILILLPVDLDNMTAEQHEVRQYD